jgi:hypothetical protein
MLLLCYSWTNILITEDKVFKEINIEFGIFISKYIYLFGIYLFKIYFKKILVGKYIVGVSYFGHTN